MQNPYAAHQSPDLSLAMTPNIASGQQETYMPVPLPAIPREQPVLSCENPGSEIYSMGIVDTVPYFDLGLAQSPDLGTVSLVPQANAPTFTQPHVAVPATRPYDLQEPGIDHVPAFTPDPQVGDLLQFDEPHGLSIMAASSHPLAIDPMAPDLALYDRPDNLLMPSPLMVDPTLPDLQSPVLTQAVHMPDRPGELATDLPLSPDGDDDDDDGAMPRYDASMMTAGMSARERRMDRLYRGLQGGL